MIVTWSKGVADYNMSENILTDLAGMMNRHPWWQARARLALTLLAQSGILPSARILDAGCGSGLLLDRLEERGYDVSGLDISRRSLEQLDRPDRMLIEADLTRCDPPESESFDAVLLLDVLEHLDDERVVLQTVRRLMKPHGLVIVSVPARPDLFSEFDRIQGHRRRYLPDSLRAVFDGTGLQVRQMMWWGAWMVPALTLQRKRRKAVDGESVNVTYKRYLQLPPWPAPSLMNLAFRWEHGRTLRNKNRSGTSLVALASRNQSLS